MALEDLRLACFSRSWRSDRIEICRDWSVRLSQCWNTVKTHQGAAWNGAAFLEHSLQGHFVLDPVRLRRGVAWDLLARRIVHGSVGQRGLELITTAITVGAESPESMLACVLEQVITAAFARRLGLDLLVHVKVDCALASAAISTVPTRFDNRVAAAPARHVDLPSSVRLRRSVQWLLQIASAERSFPLTTR